MAHASSYVRGYLAAHAAVAGLLDRLLGDPGFLIAANPSGLLPVLDSASSPPAPHVAWFYRIAAGRLRTGNLAERAAYLQLAAGKAGFAQMAEAFGEASGGWLWTTHVLSWRPPGRYTALGSTGFVRTSALTMTTRGDVWVVTGGDDGMVALWQLSAEGLRPVGDPQPGHDAGIVHAVAAGYLSDRLVAVTVGTDATMQLWHVADDGLVPVGHPQASHDPREAVLTAVALGQAGGQAVAVTGDRDRTVALWQLNDDGLIPVGDPSAWCSYGGSATTG